MDALQRRVFLKGASMGLLAFTVGGAEILMTPGEARASLDLYYPARRRRDQVLSATGVGLGLVRALARAAGGDLDFTVDAKGGARLALTWPPAEAA